MTIARAFQHSCGGWYTASENKDGFHHQPEFCVILHEGRCYKSANAALRARARAEAKWEAEWLDADPDPD